VGAGDGAPGLHEAGVIKREILWLVWGVVRVDLQNK
jgi:hypothetical protein